MFIIDVKDSVTKGLALVKNALQPHNLNPKIGVALVKVFQNHFASLPPNRRGWPTQNYFGKAARSTHFELLADGVKVAVSQVGIRMHVTGQPSTIDPVKAKNLAIPAVAAAYGRRPREFSNLKVAFRREAGKLIAFALVEGSVKTASGRVKQGPHSLKLKGFAGRLKSTGDKAERGQVIYWLKKSVHTHPMEGVVPSEETLKDAVVKLVDGEMQRLRFKE
jgi:hypothetical protein